LSEAGPVLRTERLELWRPAREDFAELYALVAPEPMRAFLGGPTTPADEFGRFLRGAGSWLLYGYGMFHVRERGGTSLVGLAGVFRSWRGFGEGLDDVPEAGWIVGLEQAGNGYATEAMRAALAWFDAAHAEPRIACMIEDGNAASMAVAARLGFREYARHRPDEGGELVLLERLRA
jgi:RimJ/RimL family protein N-acetyltransferase